MSIITYPLDGKYYNAQDAETYLCTRTSGVFSQDISFTPNGMNITVSPFLAWIKNDDFSGKSVAVTTDTTLTISPSEPILSRIDRIVLRFDARKNGSELMVLKGTPSSSPAVPSIERTPVIYDLCLCQISVKPSATSISAGDITSTLLDESLCGIMRDGVTGIPTLQLQSQAQDLIRELEVAISMAENGSPVLQSLGIKRGMVDVTIGEKGQTIYESNDVTFDTVFLDEPKVIVTRKSHRFPDIVYKYIKPQEGVRAKGNGFTLEVFSENDIPTTLTLRYNWIAIGRVAWDNDSGGGNGGGGDGGGDGGGEEDDTEYFTITTSVDPLGSGIAEGAGNFAKGSTTKLVARAFSGYTFEGWYSGNSKITSNAEHTVTVNSNATYTAKFIEEVPDIVVQINVEPAGTGTVSGAGTYKKGSTVNLGASPKEGYKFVGWFVGSSQYCDSTNYSVTLNASTTFTAKFEEEVVTPDYYTVIAKVTPTGSGTVKGGGQYTPGSTAKLTAAENEGYVFSYWSSGTETIDSAEFTFVVSSDRTWTAHFIEGEEETGKVTITTRVEPANSGTVTGGGEVTTGSMSAVQANNNSGYKFKHWRFENGETNTENPYLFRASADRTFVAVFEVDSGGEETTYTSDTLVNGTLYVGTQTTNIETDNSYASRTDITQVVIPEGRTKIGTYTLESCSNLAKVTMPSTMATINMGAFDSCSRLTEITYNGTKSQWNNISKNRAFDGDLDDITIHCTDGDVNYAKLDISVSPEGSGSVTTSPTAVTATTGDTFYVRNSTVDLTATPSSGYNFKHWILPGGYTDDPNPLVTSVSAGLSFTAVFEKIEQTETTYIDDNLKNGVLNVGTQTTNIETDDGYAGRTDIAQVIIPEGRTRIADNCFSNCSNLTSVTIPVSLTQIGSYAFDHVDNLTDIYYGGTKAQWNNISISYVFKKVDALTVHCSDGNIEYCEVDFVFSPDEGTKNFNPHTQIMTTFSRWVYVKNSTVTLKATPEDGYSFVRYERSDGVSSTSNPYSFTITQSMTVTVVTERTTTTETAKLYIYSSNAGTGDVVKLTKDEAGTQPWNKNEFSEGETAYFFAQAGTGRIIERLVFKVDNATVADMTADEMVEEGILNSDKNKLSQQHYVDEGQTSEFVATVYFGVKQQSTYTVTTEVTPTGSGTVTGGGTYTSGSTATLSATAIDGYRFSYWEFDDGGVSDDNPCYKTVNKDFTATAVFINVANGVTYKISSRNAGTGDTVGLYKEDDSTGNADLSKPLGTVTTLYAGDITVVSYYAKAGSNRKINSVEILIDGVSNGTMSGEDLNDYIVNGAFNLRAGWYDKNDEGKTFELVVYFGETVEKKTITFSSFHGTRKVVCNGVELSNSKDNFTHEFNTGDEITLTFTPDSGYQFSSWVNDDTASRLSGDNPWTFTVDSSTVKKIGMTYIKT